MVSTLSSALWLVASSSLCCHTCYLPALHWFLCLAVGFPYKLYLYTWFQNYTNMYSYTNITFTAESKQALRFLISSIIFYKGHELWKMSTLLSNSHNWKLLITMYAIHRQLCLIDLPQCDIQILHGHQHSSSILILKRFLTGPLTMFHSSAW